MNNAILYNSKGSQANPAFFVRRGCCGYFYNIENELVEGKVEFFDDTSNRFCFSYDLKLVSFGSWIEGVECCDFMHSRIVWSLKIPEIDYVFCDESGASLFAIANFRTTQIDFRTGSVLRVFDKEVCGVDNVRGFIVFFERGRFNTVSIDTRNGVELFRVRMPKETIAVISVCISDSDVLISTALGLHLYDLKSGFLKEFFESVDWFSVPAVEYDPVARHFYGVTSNWLGKPGSALIQFSSSIADYSVKAVLSGKGSGQAFADNGRYLLCAKGDIIDCGTGLVTGKNVINAIDEWEFKNPGA